MPFSDVSLYVMTPEFGAASQLAVIDMLDVADVVAVNRFERWGAEDARRDVARHMVPNRQAFGRRWGRDAGVRHQRRPVQRRRRHRVVASSPSRYVAEIAEAGRGDHATTEAQADVYRGAGRGDEHAPDARGALGLEGAARGAARTPDEAVLVSFLGRENLPRFFPFTAGVFRFDRAARNRRGWSPARGTHSAPTAVRAAVGSR